MFWEVGHVENLVFGLVNIVIHVVLSPCRSIPSFSLLPAATLI